MSNQLRMARKNLTPGVWGDWVDRCRQRHSGRLAEHPEGLWAAIWEVFEQQRASAEEERAYLMSRRVRDELWYAQRFQLNWPRLQCLGVSPAAARAAQFEMLEEPEPSPPPCKVVRQRRSRRLTPARTFLKRNVKILQPQLRFKLGDFREKVIS